MNINPYAPPSAADFAAPPTDDEQIRKEHLSHEASVKSIGNLFLVGAIFVVPFSLFVLGGAVVSAARSTVGSKVGFTPAEAILCGICLVFGSTQGATAVGLWKLQSWARWVAVVFSVIGVLAIPIGTIISGQFLYLLLSKKGTVIFSFQYKQVIAATPHIKYETSKIEIALLIILIALLGIALIVALGGFLR